MRQILQNILFPLLVGLCLLLPTACGTKRPEIRKEVVLLLTMAKDKGTPYIETQYAAYQPSRIQLASRSALQYRVIFRCTEEEEKSLRKDMEADPNILAFVDARQASSIQKSESQPASKTKPIKE